jgi:hypothetical protein
MIVAIWKVYEKAGRPGWAAIVPVYNSWVLLEMGGKPGWITLLAFIPFLGLITIVFQAIASAEIARRFGKSGVWGFFLLFLLPFIGWPILAFTDATYNDSSDGSTPGGEGVPAVAAPEVNPMPPTTPQSPEPTPPAPGPVVPPSAPPVPPVGDQTPPGPPTVSGPTVG